MDGGGLLTTLGAAVDWTDMAAGNAVGSALAAETGGGYGTLAALAGWVAAVRPADVRFPRIRLIVVDRPGEDVFCLADEVAVAVRTCTEVGADVLGAAAAGGALADAEVDSGADLLLVADALTGPEPRVLTSVLTDTEPVKVLARGAAATDPTAWMALATRVRDQRRDVYGLRNDAERLLEIVGPPRLAFLAALVLRAAARRTPVVLAGGNALVAALMAYECHPRTVRWWAAADAAPRTTGSERPPDGDLAIDPVPGLVVARLGVLSVLSLGVGEHPDASAAAALLAVPALRTAARLAARFAGTSSP